MLGGALFRLAAGEACFALSRRAHLLLDAGEACFALSRFVRRLSLLFVAFSGAAIVLTLATRAFADPSVLLVVNGAVDQDTAPFELRLRSEFAAEGLEVVTASGRSQQNLLDLEGLARKTGAVAALSVFVDAQEVQGRLWVSDPSSNTDLVRTLRVIRSEGDPVSVFALRSVEALRGARLELEQQRRRMAASGAGEPGGNAPATTGASANPASANTPATNGPVPPKTNPNPPVVKVPAPKAPPKPPPPKPAPVAMRWTLLGSFIAGYDQNGIGSIYAPALDVRYRLFDRLSAGMAFDGPFIWSREAKGAGLINVNQELIDIQARYTAWQGNLFAFDAILTTGPSRFAASGTQTVVPGAGRSVDSLGWTFGAGLGARAKLSSHWILGLDLQWMRRLPAPVIRAGTGRVTGSDDSLILPKVGIGLMF